MSFKTISDETMRNPYFAEPVARTAHLPAGCYPGELRVVLDPLSICVFDGEAWVNMTDKTITVRAEDVHTHIVVRDN